MSFDCAPHDAAEQVQLYGVEFDRDTPCSRIARFRGASRQVPSFDLRGRDGNALDLNFGSRRHFPESVL